MQNHGGYTDAFSNLSEDVHATNYNSEVLDRYLSLIRLTDQSLEKLVDYFSNVDEKTVIVFFGDHQPSDTVAAQVQDSMLLPGESVPYEQLRKRYLVPYLAAEHKLELFVGRGAQSSRSSDRCLSEFPA